MSTKTKRIAIGLAALVVLALGGAAIARATGSGENEGSSLTGQTLSKASAAALKATGGGEVTGSERDDENGATYEIEVRKPDGSTVDVRLDESFRVVVVEGDSEEPDSDDADE